MNNLNFLDLIRNPQIDHNTVILSLILSFTLGVIIALTYKKTNQGFSYDSSFGFTLVMITVIINSIMITIGTNIALSLGLIGSLSIIRFRTAIKNSMDMAFLFWCIAVGLAVGAFQYLTAIIVTVIVALVILAFNKSKFFFKANTDYVITVSLKSIKYGNEIGKMLTDYKLKWKTKSSFSDEAGSEITYSVYSKRKLNITDLLSEINNSPFVTNVSLLSPETNLFI
jgi:uncharacterized membrane protein YhiD involved in acid resistance